MQAVAGHPEAQFNTSLPGYGKRALITGIRGFTARYMEAELQAAGYQVYGTALHPSDSENIFAVDLADRTGLAAVVEQVKPDVVIHLAAIAFVAHGDAEAIYRVNVVGTRNLLEALANDRHTPQAVLLTSSANIYGNALVEPITEQTPFDPANDYAVSKLAMEYMARLWCDRLPIIITRPFNYTGVGQAENFLLPKIVSHFRRAQAHIELGNLDVARDFSDVRVVVACYRRLLEMAMDSQTRGQTIGHTFNVCSGHAVSLQEVLAMMNKMAGYEIQVSVNPAFARANEVKRLVGSNQQLQKVIGEIAAIPLLETLRWMYSV